MVVDGVTAFALIHDGGGSDCAVAISPAADTACDPHVPVTGPNTQLIVLLGVSCPIT
jgi:hypothetical protein